MNEIHYICKYTPVELIYALGGNPVPLNSMLPSFPLSDQVVEPNICGYGKSIVEECLSGRVKRLVLVNCCDSIKSVYDVLSEWNGLDFLFMFDLMHTTSECSKKKMESELKRFLKSWSEYGNIQFDKARFFSAFSHEEGVDGEYIALSGGRVGDELERLARESLSLPVRNLTCVSSRFLPPPDENILEEKLLSWYALSLLAQMPCMRMDDVLARRHIFEDERVKGIVYHTVKFCDFYNFEYSTLKNNTDLPLLKIETDFTTQSLGQLGTRLDAFDETLSKGRKEDERRVGNMRAKGYYAGIDSGSTSTDVVVIDQDGRIVASKIIPTGSGSAKSAGKALSEALSAIGISLDEIVATVSTGYGRDRITHFDKSITEITCHAKGAFFLDPEVRTIIDIGGQDSKVILLGDDGEVVNFVMNDKCAAGTGRFLDFMARTLELTLPEMSAIGLDWKEDITISSMCTVFAESEVVSLVAENKAVPDIVHGLDVAVATKTLSLVRRIGGREKYMMTGGVARNEGVVRELGRLLGSSIEVSDKAQLVGALGAALFAKEL